MPNVNFSYGTHTADHSVPESARYTANTCAKTAETIKMPFAFRTRVAPMKHVLNEVQMPTWEGAILRGKQANHCKV